jgi:hypothetical protein
MPVRPTRPIALALAIAGALAGCTAFEPFETAPVEGPKGDTKIRVGICYDTLVSSDAEITAAARTACGPGTVPKWEGIDYILMACPLLLPGRATFVCTPHK